jgi:glycine/D-amino acid oxidase-like deaminating enzyme
VRDTADIVVVGAGIVGSSIGHSLVLHGAGKVVVLDKGAGPAEGSTGASSTISRCKYTLPEMIRVALDGQRAYGEWADYTGIDRPRARLERVGVLWISADDRAAVNADGERLAAAGVAMSVLGPDELVSRFPSMSPCAVPFDLTGRVEHFCEPGEAFLLEEESGYVTDPVGATQDLADAIRRLGGDVRLRSRVTGVRTEGEKVVGVDLADGSGIDAGLVVNAAGPWCNALNKLAGVALRWRLEPTRVQVGYREWPANLVPPPVCADYTTGLYVRPEARGQQVLFGSVLAEDEEEVVADPDEFSRVIDPSFRDVKIHGVHHRFPDLPHRGGVTGIAGLYTINREDVHPVIGPTGLDGFWVANGFSGHGFKLAPMIGSMIARAVTGRRCDFDTDVPLGFLGVDREPLVVGTKSVLA